MKNKSLIENISEALSTYRGMSPASCVTQCFAYFIFNMNCAILANCESVAELNKAISDEMISQAACAIVAKATPYYNGRIEITHS